ncbi:MAG: hypothetical protein IKI28_05925 [Bacteroidales bacterium]|nr:hypothetical protein [Bacteroidales bacterium]
MTAASIPPKDRTEWRMLVDGTLDHKFQNYVLQLRIYQMRKDIKAGALTPEKALDELYQLCFKYALAVQPDLIAIFKNW